MNAILSRIFTAPFLITILRYGLAAAGAWLVARGLIDEGTWEVVGGAILTIIVALLGGADAVKDKAVMGGKSVAMTDLPADARNRIEAAVSVTKRRSLMGMLFGS